MKLVKCHIEGFGKFRDKEMFFEDGINVFCEENGFGKTTVATFLKTMFYGFEDENKRNLKEKEREKYRPWDKGTYGGSVVFENGGKTYEVTRSFGKNATDDAFEIRDFVTNAVSKDFTKDNLGAEVFGIDKASFFRTTYFASKDKVSGGENITDSIRAKLGNLTDATDDINNYETVCAKFDSLKNEYTPDRKTGKIKATKVKIAELGNELRERAIAEKSIEVLENQIVHEHEKLERNKAKMMCLKEEAKKASEAVSKKAKRETYDSIKAEYNESVKNATEAVSIFTKRIPNQNEIEEISKAEYQNRQLIKTMNENRFYADDEWKALVAKFESETPAENEISEMLRIWNEREECKKTSVYLAKCRDEAVKRYVDSERERIEKENEENRKTAAAVNENKKKKKILFVVFSALSALAAVLAAFLTKNMNMGVHIGTVALFLVLSVLFAVLIFVKKLNSEEAFSEKDVNSVTPENASTASEEVARIDGRITANNETLAEKENIVKTFLSKYGEDFNEKNVNVILFKLSEGIKAYEEGKKKIKKFELTEKEYLETEDKIEGFFESIGANAGDNREETIGKLREALVKKEQFDKETERKKLIIENFEADNNIDELLSDDEETIKDREDIEDELADIEEENDRTKALIENFRMKLSDEQEKLEVLSGKEIEASELKETLKQYEDFYRIMELTRGYLSKAKDELSLKYTGPTMNAFKKYMSYFGEKLGKEYRIDTNFNLTKTEEGMQREMKDLSFGLRDATDFCLRLAFADAMYEDEKTFLILDDPFVNFDRNNLEAAGKVLEKVKNDYQVIYFTCHESRGGV